MASSIGEYTNHPLWEFERTLGDILSRLHTIRQRAEVAMDHADNADLRYPEDSLNQIYAEMDQQIRELVEFKQKLLEVQEVILKAIKSDSEGGQVIPFRRTG